MGEEAFSASSPASPSAFSRVRRSGWARAASCSARLRGPHLGDAILVDLDDVAPRVCTLSEALEAFWPPTDDRVRIGTGLDHVTLVDLLLEECVEAILARPKRVDLSHGPEYGKRHSASGPGYGRQRVRD